ncbi:MAG: glycosyltransferase family 2 protein [Acidobacteriota bacterium]
MAAILLPTLNEEGSIRTVLEGIPGAYRDGVLVIDGGSTDNTVAIVEEMGFPVIPQQGKGLGCAIVTGIEATSDEMIVAIDTDGSHEPRQIPEFIAKLEEGYDLVVASRYSDGPPDAHMFSPKRRSTSDDDTALRAFGNRSFTYLCQLLFGLPVHDVLNGYKAWRRSIHERVVIRGQQQDYDIDLLLQTHLEGYRVTDLGSVEYPRIAGVSKLSVPKHGTMILANILKHYGRRLAGRTRRFPGLLRTGSTPARKSPRRSPRRTPMGATPGQRRSRISEA